MKDMKWNSWVVPSFVFWHGSKQLFASHFRFYSIDYNMLFSMSLIILWSSREREYYSVVNWQCLYTQVGRRRGRCRFVSHLIYIILNGWYLPLKDFKCLICYCICFWIFNTLLLFINLTVADCYLRAQF